MERAELITRAEAFRRDALRSVVLSGDDGGTAVQTRQVHAEAEGQTLHFYLIRPAGKHGTPFVVNLHGGGMVLGHAERDLAFCRRLASGTGLSVVSLDYAQVPENPYSRAYEQTLALVRYLCGRAKELDIRPKYALIGESSGGTLAISAARHFAGTAQSAEGVVCCYTVFDYVTDPEKKLAAFSCEKRQLYTFFRACCFAGEPDLARRNSPLFWPPEAIRQLPKMFFVEPENDELREENEKMYHLTAGLELDSSYRLYRDSGHAFLINQKGDWRRACADVCAVLAGWLA